MKADILAVDDTSESLKLLTDILVSEGYKVRSAITGELAIQSAAASPPDLILLDVNMPEMNGFEVCQKLKENPDLAKVPVIFVSALSETQEKVKGFQFGAMDYVTKPFQREELLARVHTHLELNRLYNHLEDMVEERTRSLNESEIRLKKSLFDAISAIAATVEMRDPYTAGHQRRVSKLAVAIAEEMGLSGELIDGVNLASLVHDVGKIGIPAEILTKPGRLSDLEFNLMKEHPKTGYEILKSIEFPWPIAQIVYQHQERLDGSGYPGGLKGEDILLEARIIAVADVVEAMASDRPYRAAVGLESALEEINGKKDILYDKTAVDACLNLFREKEFNFG